MGSSSIDAEEDRFFAPSPDAAYRLATDPFRPPGDGGDPPAAGGVAGTLSAFDATVSALAPHQRLARLHKGIARAVAVEMERGTPFTFVPVFLAIGAFAYFVARAEPSLWALFGASGALAVTAFAARRSALAQLIAAALLCISLGALFAKVETIRAGTKMLGGEITTRLTGRIVATDHLASGRVRLTLDVIATERPSLRHAPERVRVSARAIPAGTEAGDVLEGVVRLLPTRGPVRPGAYDFAFESYFDGVGATGFFLMEPTLIATSDPPTPSERLGAVVENTRDTLAARIRDTIGGAEGEIAAALIAGVRAGIPEDVNEALRRTGLAHVLSISGLHMALVAATIMGAMRAFFACFQNFSARRPVRKYAGAVALAVLAVYLFISGYQVAAQRSFIMIAIMLIALLFDHAALTMRNLALAAIVVIVVSPHEVVGPSFQMSFAATAALIGAYAAWSRRRPQGPHARSSHLLLRAIRLVVLYVLGLAATSLLAGVATTIYGAYHFQRVSPLGLAANLAAMPVVSVLVMPFAVLGVVAMPFGLDDLPFGVMGQGLRMMVAIARWFSDRSPIDVIGMIAPSAIIALTIALVLATLLTTWLRLLAVPFIAGGLVLCFLPPTPRLIVSEDGRLAALLTEDGRIALNRSGPNDFTLRNWESAMAASGVSKPILVDQAADGEASAMPAAGADDVARFTCTRSTCVARLDGDLVVTTSDLSIARAACGDAAVLIFDDPTVVDICPATAGLVITRRELARWGSAMIFRETLPSRRSYAAPSDDAVSANAANPHVAPGSQALPVVESQRSGQHAYRATFATFEPYRPWHVHRQFSREARGLPPWKPDPAKAKRKPAAG
ncbi:ComEC/Rec2 family competence protein [Arvimicrobium flavum]|uniref:ComEC/Rec2 family competence protein n=1 Tax=Arvimicrobium flavum TaxID=3393320 RepID=UPI00237A8792|nr:ComEC/Rec2 family competence protein [Mesorhizobium shangrilense]